MLKMNSLRILILGTYISINYNNEYIYLFTVTVNTDHYSLFNIVFVKRTKLFIKSFNLHLFSISLHCIRMAIIIDY